jgi:hypothetical protein
VAKGNADHHLRDRELAASDPIEVEPVPSVPTGSTSAWSHAPIPSAERQVIAPPFRGWVSE